MARALANNENLLKIGYSFKVQSARSLADRSQIRNNEISKYFMKLRVCMGVIYKPVESRDACEVDMEEGF